MIWRRLAAASALILLPTFSCAVDFDGKTCAVSTVEGISTEASIFVAKSAVAAGLAKVQGDAIVYNRFVCSITPPDIPPLASDLLAEVTVRTVDANGHLRCSINTRTLERRLEEDHAGDLQTVQSEIIRFYATGLIAQQISFFSNDALVVPNGFQVLVGKKCTDHPDTKQARNSLSVALKAFDGYVRWHGALVACARQTPFLRRPSSGMGTFFERHAPDVSNAWAGFELDMIARAMGMTSLRTVNRRKGDVAYPPMCHFP